MSYFCNPASARRLLREESKSAMFERPNFVVIGYLIKQSRQIAKRTCNELTHFSKSPIVFDLIAYSTGRMHYYWHKVDPCTKPDSLIKGGERVQVGQQSFCILDPARNWLFHTMLCRPRLIFTHFLCNNPRPALVISNVLPSLRAMYATRQDTLECKSSPQKNGDSLSQPGWSGPPFKVSYIPSLACL